MAKNRAAPHRTKSKPSATKSKRGGGTHKKKRVRKGEFDPILPRSAHANALTPRDRQQSRMTVSTVDEFEREERKAQRREKQQERFRRMNGDESDSENSGNGSSDEDISHARRRDRKHDGQQQKGKAHHARNSHAKNDAEDEDEYVEKPKAYESLLKSLRLPQLGKLLQSRQKEAEGREEDDESEQDDEIVEQEVDDDSEGDEIVDGDSSASQGEEEENDEQDMLHDEDSHEEMGLEDEEEEFNLEDYDIVPESENDEEDKEEDKEEDEEEDEEDGEDEEDDEEEDEEDDEEEDEEDVREMQKKHTPKVDGKQNQKPKGKVMPITRSGEKQFVDIHDDGAAAEDEAVTDKNLVEFGVEETHADDPYTQQYELEEDLLDHKVKTKVEKLAKLFDPAVAQKQKPAAKQIHDWSVLGGSIYITEQEHSLPQIHASLAEYRVKQRLNDQIKSLRKKLQSSSKSDLPDFQNHLFGLLNTYKDLYYPCETLENIAGVRQSVALHALNHVFKSRDKILRGNAKINAAKIARKEHPEIRDQGFTRPTVLIVAPFRHSAKEYIDLFVNLSPKVHQDQVANKKRFYLEYGAEDEEEDDSNDKKPVDYKKLFEGNIDDCFRVGISFAKRSMKLYSDFYSSDIIIASPLGLRLLIGSPGDKKRDYDFLSSIEVVIMDQTEVFLMQNWDHVVTLFDTLNLLPAAPNKTDFSRVREWALSGKCKNVRQTVICSAFANPEFNALFSRWSHNASGQIKVRPTYPGTIANVARQTRQFYQRIDCRPGELADDRRFEYFTKQVLPHMRSSIQQQTLVFVRNYFEYVRLRNYFKKEEVSFCQLCEYTSNSSISRSRFQFFHKERELLLFTERFHFFRRYRIRGIRNIIFYSLPDFAHFYPEVVNLMESSDGKQICHNSSASWEQRDVSACLPPKSPATSFVDDKK